LAKVISCDVCTDAKKNTDRILDLHLDGVETTFREVSMSKNINETINRFIQKENCDLLCMILRKKGFFESVFQKSITKAQVFSNQVPLLVFHKV
jgi:hypothetical protein